MSTFIQDYKNWRAMVGRYRRCVRERNQYRSEIKGVMPLEFCAGKAYSLTKEVYDLTCEGIMICELLVAELEKNPDKNDIVQEAIKEALQNKEILHSVAQTRSCFFRLVAEPFPGFDLITITSRHVYRCPHNHPNGDINESECAGCPHFSELIEYQKLAAKADVARENLNAAKQKLFGHFKVEHKTK